MTHNPDCIPAYGGLPINPFNPPKSKETESSLKQAFETVGDFWTVYHAYLKALCFFASEAIHAVHQANRSEIALRTGAIAIRFIKETIQPEMIVQVNQMRPKESASDEQIELSRAKCRREVEMLCLKVAFFIEDAAYHKARRFNLFSHDQNSDQPPQKFQLKQAIEIKGRVGNIVGVYWYLWQQSGWSYLVEWSLDEGNYFSEAALLELIE